MAGYRELAERLATYGLKETEASIPNKISRGTFSATFLLASLKAIEADNLKLEKCLMHVRATKTRQEQYRCRREPTARR